MIHGRFQPFHRGHAAYLAEAASRCETIVVGITNPDASCVRETDEDDHRHLPSANPFSFVERLTMVRAAAHDLAITDSRVEIVPFPIHHPDRWASYVRAGTVMYLRVLSPWGERKRRLFEQHGYATVLLADGTDSTVTGTAVRERLIAGQSIDGLVPPSVAKILAARPSPREPSLS